MKVSTPEPAQTFSLGDVKFTILGPVKSYSDLNNNSIVLKMTYGNTSFIFTGDAESSSEIDVVNRGYNLSADVLKVGHHGSSTSTSSSFLQAVSPKYAVISVGSGNKYGHPAQDTLIKLAETNTNVYRTDESGTIIAKSDGQRITFDKKASEMKKEEYPSKLPKATEAPKVTEAPKATEAPKVTEASKATEVPKPEPTKEETQKAVETPVTDNVEEVYITNTGSKYHRESCSSLRKSKIPISLKKAKSDGYGPCGRCY